MANKVQTMEQPTWLEPDEMDAWLEVLALVEFLPAALDAQLRRDADLGRFEYSILAMLNGAPDRTMRMLELSRVTFGSPSRLSHAVSRLEARGCVTREQRGGTRYATLTDSGRALLRQVAPLQGKVIRHCIFDRLRPGQAKMLAEILAPITQQFQETTPRR